MKNKLFILMYFNSLNLIQVIFLFIKNNFFLTNNYLKDLILRHPQFVYSIGNRDC